MQSDGNKRSWQKQGKQNILVGAWTARGILNKIINILEQIKILNKKDNGEEKYFRRSRDLTTIVLVELKNKN